MSVPTASAAPNGWAVRLRQIGGALSRPGLRLVLIGVWSGCLIAVAFALMALGAVWMVEAQVAQRRAQAELALRIAADLLPIATQGSDVLAINGYLHDLTKSTPFLDMGYYSVTLGMSFDTRLLEPQMAHTPADVVGIMALESRGTIWIGKPNRIDLAQAVRLQGELIGVIMASLPADDRARLHADAMRTMLGPALIVTILGLVGGIVAAIRLTRPIETMLVAYERLAAGILTTPALPNQGPEVARLGIAVQRLVATLRQNADRIDVLVTRDPLTGLVNRETFVRQAGLMLAGLANRHAPATLILIEVFGLRGVYDRHGDAIGDSVLRVVTRRLSSAIDVPNLLPDRPTLRTDRDGVQRPLQDLVGRLGAMEFGVLLHNAGVAADVSVLAEQLRAIIAEPIEIEDVEVTLKLRIGISIKRGATLDYPSLRRSAGAALIEARVSGKTLVFADSAQSTSLGHVPSYALAD